MQTPTAMSEQQLCLFPPFLSVE